MKQLLGWTVCCAHVLAATIPSVVTYHYNKQRTGQISLETILTQSNVNPTTFGKLFSQPVDGQVFAQPLYVPGLTINSQVHNAVFVATENDSVYAFDADSNTGSNANPLWHTSFINPPSVVPVPSDDVKLGYDDITPQIGITGTPVIVSNRLFVVAKTKETDAQGNVTYVQRLHALNITTGLETVGSPVVIAPTFPGTCIPNDGQGNMTFNPLLQNQRSALLAANGVIYVAWASHGDTRPFHGWLVGYSEVNLQQVSVFNAGPDNAFDCNGGFWASGSGPAADSAGNIYVASGNGLFKPPASGGNSYGDSWIRLTSSLLPMDYFTPHDQQTMDKDDKDMGSGGIVLLPDQPGSYPHLMFGASKEGWIYLVNRDSMGMYNANGDTQIVQELPSAMQAYFGAPVYYQGRAYIAGVNASIQAYSLVNGQLQTPPVQTTSAFQYPGAGITVSSGPTGPGILWALDSRFTNKGATTAILHAYKADDLTKSLYSSNTNATRDAPGLGVKFAVPVVVNGKVYIGGASALTVYGLLQ